MPSLMRLEVPRGWSVLDNKFCDVDPVIESDHRIKNWYEGFTEDVLWIRECKVNSKGEFAFPEYRYFSIDLSWLPDSTADGKYHARLHWIGSDDMKVVDKLDSTNRMTIRDRIEYWMSNIHLIYKEMEKKGLHE